MVLYRPWSNSYVALTVLALLHYPRPYHSLSCITEWYFHLFLSQQTETLIMIPLNTSCPHAWINTSLCLSLWCLVQMEFNCLRSLIDFVMFLFMTEEKRTAQTVRHKLWELLAPAGLTKDSGSSPWLQSYRQLLQEEGADEETQRRAVLMQLWATQVSQTSVQNKNCGHDRQQRLSKLLVKSEMPDAAVFVRVFSTPLVSENKIEIEVWIKRSTHIWHTRALFISAFTAGAWRGKTWSSFRNIKDRNTLNVCLNML